MVGLGFAQVRVAPNVTNDGGVVFPVICIVRVAVHPFKVLVIRAVYIPAALTTTVFVVPPLTIPGPDQETVAVAGVVLAIILSVG